MTKDEIFNAILGKEGGYVNHPDDKGGPTNWGITQAVARVPGFTEKVTDWLARCPDDLLSFYLGTGRPPQYQMQIAERLIIADKARYEFISFPRLIHGVCYSVPPHRINRVLSRWDSDKPADFAVGDAWGGSVIYPCYSLVDHADGEPVERHPDSAPRTERRRAWRLA